MVFVEFSNPNTYTSKNVYYTQPGDQCEAVQKSHFHFATMPKMNIVKHLKSCIQSKYLIIRHIYTSHLMR